MFKWLLILIGLGALIGFLVNAGKSDKDARDGAAAGAAIGFSIFMNVLYVVLPILLLLALIRSCS